jgi:hypothetical protein
LRPDLEQLADPVQAAKAALRAVAVRILSLEQEIKLTDQRLGELVPKAAPRTLGLLAIGIQHAGQLLTTAGDSPERLRGEASFAHLCATWPARSTTPSWPTSRHSTPLDVYTSIPQRLGRVELGGVGGEPLDREPGPLGGQAHAHLVAPRRARPIHTSTTRWPV